MYRKDFCDIHVLKKRIAEGKKWPNVIINTITASEHRSDIKGTLSIFTHNRGEGYYSASAHRKRVTEDTYCISNQNEEYGIDIEHSSTVETFNIHFSTDMLKELLPSLLHSHSSLADNGYNTELAERDFQNKLYWKDETVRNIIALLQCKASSNELNENISEEIFANLLEHICDTHFDDIKKVEDISAVKYATRKELMKRLSHSVDYIHSLYTSEINLNELSRVANMSKYHFLRVFKGVYNCTPYQYIIKRRLEKATYMLQDNLLSVQDVAFAVGYDDTSSFSRAFKKETGIYPLAYRAISQK